MAELLTDCLYRGERRKSGTTVVVHDAPTVSHALTAGPASEFDWGRPTPGAQLLAATLLLDALASVPAPELQARFLHEVVLQLPFMEPWHLWRREVREFADRVTS